MRWLMNINGDIWRQDTDLPLKMIETKTSSRPETIEFLHATSVLIQFPVEKTINDIRKEMLEAELESQQNKTKGECHE